MYRDVVYQNPEGDGHFGPSPVCSVQGMYTKGHVITVQSHPEFDEEIMTEFLRTRHTMGVFNDEDLDEYKKKLVKPRDGAVVGRAFIEFLLAD